MSALGDKLTALRDSKALTTADLAEAAGVDERTMSGILSGDVARPPEDGLRGLAERLDTEFEDLRELIPADVLEARDDGQLLEATAAEGGGASKFLIRVIRADVSGNGNYYPDSVLREALPLFDGARVLAKSDEEHLSGRGKGVRNLFGRLTAPAFTEGQGVEGGEIRATLEMLEPAGGVAVKLRESVDRGRE